jgi:hypothetical protein
MTTTFGMGSQHSRLATAVQVQAGRYRVQLVPVALFRPPNPPLQTRQFGATLVSSLAAPAWKCLPLPSLKREVLAFDATSRSSRRTSYSAPTPSRPTCDSICHLVAPIETGA